MSVKLSSFEQMEAFVKSHNTRKKVAVACAHDDVTLEAGLGAGGEQDTEDNVHWKKNDD